MLGLANVELSMPGQYFPKNDLWKHGIGNQKWSENKESQEVPSWRKEMLGSHS